MKVEFRDELQRDAIHLFFEINDGLERDITAEKADIEWSLTLNYCSWGINSYNYALSILTIPISIDTSIDGEIENKKLHIEVKFNPKKSNSQYICRIYEEVLLDSKWVEDEFISFPIDLIVEEKPSTDTDNRSQVFIKFIEIDISSEEKKLKLSI